MEVKKFFLGGRSFCVKVERRSGRTHYDLWCLTLTDRELQAVSEIVEREARLERVTRDARRVRYYVGGLMDQEAVEALTDKVCAALHSITGALEVTMRCAHGVTVIEMTDVLDVSRIAVMNYLDSEEHLLRVQRIEGSAVGERLMRFTLRGALNYRRQHVLAGVINRLATTPVEELSCTARPVKNTCVHEYDNA